MSLNQPDSIKVASSSFHAMFDNVFAAGEDIGGKDVALIDPWIETADHGTQDTCETWISTMRMVLASRLKPSD